jgi:hypothetical protein
MAKKSWGVKTAMSTTRNLVRMLMFEGDDDVSSMMGGLQEHPRNTYVICD